jgi:DNA polymerase IV
MPLYLLNSNDIFMIIKPTNNRKIIHIDMDAFFASVEQRDNPKLRGKPLIVGGMPDSRGVVSTCSYEARKYGIHSAMSSARAYKLCPSALFIHPNFEKYQYASKQINEIFHQFTDLVEPLSLDEAFLDVTQNKKNMPSATIMAKQIRFLIFRETNLTASAGVSYNKFLAKVASDINKPNGITVITPIQAEDFIEKLPINKFFGIGKITSAKMEKLGIHTGRDLKLLSIEKIIELFGKNGVFYYYISRGIDNRPVTSERVRKSYGKEITLSHDISGALEILKIVNQLCHELLPLLEKDRIKAKTLTLKIKYSDFKSVTRSTSFSNYKKITKKLLIDNSATLTKLIDENKRIRLVGISVSNLEDKTIEYFQPEFKF